MSPSRRAQRMAVRPQAGEMNCPTRIETELEVSLAGECFDQSHCVPNPIFRADSPA